MRWSAWRSMRAGPSISCTMKSSNVDVVAAARQLLDEVADLCHAPPGNVHLRQGSHQRCRRRSCRVLCRRRFLQRSQGGDGLLLAALIDLAPLLGRLAVPVVVVAPRRRPVLHAWVLVVGTRGPARSALHGGSRSVLVLLLRT